MADQGLWFKLWATCLTDPDLRNLSLEDFARWCLFGTFMKVHGNNGVLKVLKPALALQENMRCKSYEEVILVLQKFPHCCVREEGKRGTDEIVPLIIEWQNWSKYQYDYSTIRTRKFRDRERFKKRREEKRKEENISPTPHGEFLAAWNSHCHPLPKSEQLNEDRKKKIAVRWKEKPDLNYWSAVARRLAASDFACKGNWATFDWIIANGTNHVKVTEGNYDNKSTLKNRELVV